MRLTDAADTIVALATPAGVGAISVIRLSGSEAISICNKVFYSKKETRELTQKKSHTLHFGTIRDKDHIIDEVLVAVFKGPNSFTGQDSVEISCHGSVYIQNQLIQLFIREGARLAKAGEFTMRAFMNGKMDLSQAEAVADLIASGSDAAHKLALNQMRGGISNEIKELRQELINFASLIELELDFAEEDVEFADRTQLNQLLTKISKKLHDLTSSFAAGNAIKNGIPVAIVGEPNVGKSTLLNALLQEEKAIVSEIAGTTRDAIEDEISIEGISFRFIDTAGIRETTDTIESIGISRTFEKIKIASIVLFLFDAGKASADEIKKAVVEMKTKLSSFTPLIVINKIDQLSKDELEKRFTDSNDFLFISAQKQTNIDELRQKLLSFVNLGGLSNNENIITNSRHYEALSKALVAINSVASGLNTGITGDLLAIDIRQALHHLGEVTGEITTEDLLGNIFSKFCIGK